MLSPIMDLTLVKLQLNLHAITFVQDQATTVKNGVGHHGLSMHAFWPHALVCFAGKLGDCRLTSLQ